MKCPKCNQIIDDDALTCPSCKKVLKLTCPNCKTINTKNTCKKCGFVIVTKCYKCGKINQTSQGKCSKCGFSTYTSASINSSNIDAFACITIEFPNISDIKIALGSTKLYEKFKINLDNLIFNYTNSIDLTREIIDNIYVIRFNKDHSFAESANHAIKSAIEIQNLVTELNFKLAQLNKVTLQSNIAVLERNVYSTPSEYKSGFDIRLINTNVKTDKLLTNLQIITDTGVYEAVCDKYSLSSISAVQIKDKFVMFFELKLKKYIKLPEEIKEDQKESKLSVLKKADSEKFEDYKIPESRIYNPESINFNELKCQFVTPKAVDLIPEIVRTMTQNKKSIISVKCDKRLEPKTKYLLDAIESTKTFSKIFCVTCTDEMKYKPYGFFSELISNIYDYSQSPVNFPRHDFSRFTKIDESGFIRDLINLTERTFPHPEDVRYSLFDIFLELFYSIPNSLLYIENFEKIDDTSLEVLQIIFDKFEELNVSYLAIGNSDFSLHKNMHSLLFKPYYTEITPRPSAFVEIIETGIDAYQHILDSYYIQKLSQNTKGSTLYFQQALAFLLEKNILKVDKGVLYVNATENILIPTTVDDMIAKRLAHLSKDANCYKLFTLMLLIGPRVDVLTLDLLELPNHKKEAKKLMDMGYIYANKNSIYVQNYNMYKDIFLKTASEELLAELSKELLEKVYNTDVIAPATANLYKTLKLGKKEFLAWEKLSHLNISMGDFSAYLNCSIRFLKLLDNYIDDNSQKTIDDYKMEVYENLASLLYKYTPDKIQNIAQIILENLEKTTDDKKVINLCNKMLQGCLISGDYSHALELIHKILSKFPPSSLNPADKNFNISYFLISLVKIEVMFSIGNLNDCIESGDQILSVITSENIEKLKPANLSTQQFEDIIFDSAGFVAISRIILLKNDLEEFLNKLALNIGKLPEIFELFLLLQKRLSGEVAIPETLELSDDKFSKIIFGFLQAFDHKDDYKKFASDIYQSKINAKLQNLKQIELICDLLIGYSYFKLKEHKKASSVYYSVIGTSSDNGLKMVWHFAWYLATELKLEMNEIDVAYGIANNIIIQLEKDSNSSELMLLLFKLAMYKILMAKNEPKSAQLCLNHALFIKDKYALDIGIASIDQI